MGTLRHFSVYVLVVILTPWHSIGQEAQHLVVVDTVRIAEQHDRGLAVVEPMKCSPEGDLYLRFARGAPEPGVTIISEEGQVNRLTLASVPQLNNSSFLDYAPAPHSSVVLLVGKRVHPPAEAEYYVVSLRKDASNVTKMDTQSGLALRQIAVLGDSFVASGYLKGLNSRAAPFVGIFDNRGQLERQVQLAGDLTAQDIAQSRAEDKGNDQSGLDSFTAWLDVSSLQTADDGRVYLMRKSPAGPVFLIAPGGAVEKVELKPPTKDAVLSTIKVNHGSIAAEYYLPTPSSSHRRTYYLTVTDIATRVMRQKIRYESSQAIGVGLTCYDEKGFEFLSQDSDGYLQIVIAVGG
jgi:hypothetical protein